MNDQQIGLEESPADYVEKLVDVFREVRRVLRDDGTVWLNLGDSYASAGGARGYGSSDGEVGRGDGVAELRQPPNGYKAKDLMLIPARVAIALVEDGWWLRSDVIWHKPNAMPSSVTDRPTSAHEHVFLLAKSERYFYDQDAIREPHTMDTNGRNNPALRSEREGTRNVGGRTDGFTKLPSRPADYYGHELGRNKRDVWTIPSQPYADSHFATFPTKLVEPALLAGSPDKACGQCGAPIRRVTERVDMGWDGARYGERAVAAAGFGITGSFAGSTLGSSNGRLTGKRRTTGWQPSCDHDTGTKPALVLDPFAGSGTVGVVCSWYGRDFIGIELSPEYVKLAERRIQIEGDPGWRDKHDPPQVSVEQLALEIE